MSYYNWGTKFRDNIGSDISGFDQEAFGSILEVVDSYAIGLELTGKNFQYTFIKDTTTKEYHARVSCWTQSNGENKNTGFGVVFYQNTNDVRSCEFKISLSRKMYNLNTHKIAGMLRKHKFKWVKHETKITVSKYLHYSIVVKDADQLSKLIEIFSCYLP